MKIPTTIEFGKQVYNIWVTERPTQLAAALAYYGMFSFAPVIYLAFTLAGLFINQVSAYERLYSNLSELFGPETAQYIQDAINSIDGSTLNGSPWASIISFFALLFAASGLFLQLQYALNTIWHVPRPEGGRTIAFVRQRLFSFLMVIAVGLLLVVVTAINFLLNWIGSWLERLFGIEGTPMAITLVAAFLLLTLALTLIYKFVPEAKIAWRDVLVGSMVTALLIILAGFVVGFYFSRGGINSAFEVAGAFAVVVISIYYLAQIFLLGAVVSRVYAETYGSRRVFPGQGVGTKSNIQ